MMSGNQCILFTHDSSSLFLITLFHMNQIANQHDL